MNSVEINVENINIKDKHYTVSGKADCIDINNVKYSCNFAVKMELKEDNTFIVLNEDIEEPQKI